MKLVVDNRKNNVQAILRIIVVVHVDDPFALGRAVVLASIDLRAPDGRGSGDEGGVHFEVGRTLLIDANVQIGVDVKRDDMSLILGLGRHFRRHVGSVAQNR